MKKDLLTLRDITRDDLDTIFELAAKLKAERGRVPFTPLAGRSIGLILAKSSTRRARRAAALSGPVPDAGRAG